MSYELIIHHQCERDLKKIKRAGWDMEKVKEALLILRKGPPFPAKYHVHELQGEMQGIFDMHVAHNWLILFAYTKENTIEILRTGTHASINLTE
jgi:mRNA interferase YafQ